LSQGFTNQTTYTWSRSIGTSISDPRNRSTKTLATFHRTHDIRSNGTFELPFGPGRPLLSNAPGWLSRIVERWQLGGVFSWNSGAPLTFIGGPSPFMLLGNTNNRPDLVGNFPKSTGKVTITSTAGRITYFEGLQRVPDPSRSNVTTSENLRAASTVTAVADAQGNILLQNAPAGRLGSMGQNWIEGPGQIGMNANLIKSVRIGETKEFVLRLDAVNVLNHPNFGNPTMDINSVNFGVIALPTTGNRTFTFSARLNF
jgi:hypothetical protein